MSWMLALLGCSSQMCKHIADIPTRSEQTARSAHKSGRRGFVSNAGWGHESKLIGAEFKAVIRIVK
jgi:hypothetical protein